MVRPGYAAVEAKINEIEAEMKKVGMWQKEPLPPEQLDVRAAFGQDKLAFEEWLQFIFIPRVREIIATKGDWPHGSQVSDQAWREWKQWGSEDQYDHLLDLLRQFDALFRRHRSGCATAIALLLLATALVAASIRALIHATS